MRKADSNLVLSNDNNGYRYGVEYNIRLDNYIETHCKWFVSEKEANDFYDSMLFESVVICDICNSIVAFGDSVSTKSKGLLCFGCDSGRLSIEL